METTSHIGAQAGQLLPGTLNIISSTTPGTVQANGTGVALDLVGPNATLVNQNLYALNGSTVTLDGRDLSQVTLTGTGGGVFRGGTGAIGGTLGTSNQDVSALSTLSSSTLTGISTTLLLSTNEKIAVDAATPFHVTNGATFSLTGQGGQQVLSSSGTQLARISVDQGGTLSGAGGASNYIGLTVGSGGHLVVGNANFATPTRANQTLTLLGDLRLDAASSTNFTIFGANTDNSSLLLAGSNFNGSLTPASFLAGTLSVTVASGLNLLPVGQASAPTFILFQESGAGFGNSVFSNAPVTGSTLTSTDGNWVVNVNYTATTVYLSNAAHAGAVALASLSSVTAVPEPSTWAAWLGLASLAGVALRRYRAKRPSAPAS